MSSRKKGEGALRGFGLFLWDRLKEMERGLWEEESKCVVSWVWFCGLGLGIGKQWVGKKRSLFTMFLLKGMVFLSFDLVVFFSFLSLCCGGAGVDLFDLALVVGLVHVGKEIRDEGFTANMEKNRSGCLVRSLSDSLES